MDNYIINKVIPEVDIITPFVYYINKGDRLLKTIILTNIAEYTSNISVIISTNVDEISDKDYIYKDYELLEGTTAFLNIDITLNQKEILFIKSTEKVIFTAIGNG